MARTNERIYKCAPLLVLALASCGAPEVPRSNGDPCADFEVEVEHVWSRSIRADAMGYGGGVEAAQRDKVANKMDHISEDWVRLRTSTCRDHFVRKIITADEYRTRARCLDDTLEHQRRLVTLLKAGDLVSSGAIADSLLEVRNVCNR